MEYETLGAFGANCLVTDAEAIMAAGHLCNAYGADTISVGSVVAFAMECYEHGIITRKDADGIDLKWGDPRAMVALTEKVVRREGFGDVLADGVKIASEHIGKGSAEFAVHIAGQEPGMHDPKLPGPHHAGAPSAAMYAMDATPGRHTQAFGPSSFMTHVCNSMGACMIIAMRSADRNAYVEKMMRAITGWDCTIDELLTTGERIANMRHVFNLREGINPLQRFVHPRIIGRPPQTEGPLAGVSLDLEAESYWNLGALDWDRVTTKPSKAKLLALGLDDVAKDLYPQ